MKQLTLRESQLVYQVTLDEDLLHQEVILERNGRPVAVILPFEAYQAFRIWQQKDSLSLETADTFEQERLAFQKLMPELLRLYPGKVVDIYQEQVVEVGDEVVATTQKVYQQFGYVPCYVQRVEQPERVYHMPYRKVVKY